MQLQEGYLRVSGDGEAILEGIENHSKALIPTAQLSLRLPSHILSGHLEPLLPTFSEWVKSSNIVLYNWLVKQSVISIVTMRCDYTIVCRKAESGNSQTSPEPHSLNGVVSVYYISSNSFCCHKEFPWAFSHLNC